MNTPSDKPARAVLNSAHGKLAHPMPPPAHPVRLQLTHDEAAMIVAAMAVLAMSPPTSMRIFMFRSRHDVSLLVNVAFKVQRVLRALLTDPQTASENTTTVSIVETAAPEPEDQFFLPLGTTERAI